MFWRTKFVVPLLAVVVLFSCNKDRVLPEVTILSPAANALANGFITITAKAWDNRSVPSVDFSVNGRYLATDSTGSDSVYTAIWDARAEALGTQHTLSARALDAAGNTATTEVTITIGIPAGPTYHSGSVQHPETWNPIGNPHIVNGNLQFNSVVTIMPGVQVLVDPGSAIRVGTNGGLMARGTATEPIVITSNTSTPAPGDWDGIEISAGAIGDSVFLEYCTISYGGHDSTKANLVCKSSPIIVQHCTFSFSGGYGVWVASNNLSTFSANTLSSNHRYALRIDSRYASVVDESNLFFNNGGGIQVVGGIVSETSIWRNANAPYVIMSDLIVGNSAPAILQLDRGVTLRFRPGTGIIIGEDSKHIGGLVALGAPGEPVTFTSDSCFPHPGDWDGISLHRLTHMYDAILDNCVIEYGGGNGFGNIYADSVALTVTNSLIQKSSRYGIVLKRSGFRSFHNNTIQLCESYPVLLDPDYVSTAGANTLDRGLAIAGGTIAHSAVWDYSGYPRVILGIVEIGNASTPVVTIRSGNSLLFGDSAVLRIGSLAYGSGALRTDGAVFSSLRQMAGAWSGIEFLDYTVDDSSYIINSTVAFGGGNGFGNILCRGSEPLITGNNINLSSSWGIFLHNSLLNADSLRANNSFSGNVLGKVGPGGP